ncbi:MAG: hypothetical protein JKP90_00480 [Desulfofustis sp. PB-SRB1]|nr:hypothetical protein [Desulfofustis sp. PB-SRB1]
MISGKLKKISFPYLIAVFLLGCDGSAESIVILDFEKRFSNAKLISAIPTEGDFGTVYFQIEYEDENKKRQKIYWQYQKNDEGAWEFKSEVYSP